MCQASRACVSANELLSIVDYAPISDDDLYSVALTVECDKASGGREMFLSLTIESGIELHFPLASNGLRRPVNRVRKAPAVVSSELEVRA